MSMHTAPRRPILYWDGDCGFCRKWVDRWQESSGESVEYQTLQHAPSYVVEAAGGDPPQQIVLKLPDGTLLTGAHAALTAVQNGGLGAKFLLRLYERVPAFSTFTESFYRWIANHRGLCGSLTKWLWGSSTLKPTYEISGWLFPRLMGAIFASAFISLWVQIDGLSGSQGILPVSSHLDAVHAHFAAAGESSEPFRQIPSLLWFGASDRLLHFWLGVGTLSSFLLMLGFWSALASFVSWACYLSFAAAVPVFLNFQWDALLLEAGFLVVLYVPWVSRLRCGTSAPTRLGRLLVWWLLFRLMFESGVVKLFGYDATGYNAWLAGTALNFHYFTQPMPVSTSWWFSHLPGWFHRLSLLVVFLVELLLPFGIAGARRVRMTVFWGVSVLMILIIASGHYGFFNLLTLALCITLIDDQSWPDRVRRWVKKNEKSARTPKLPDKVHHWILIPLAALIFCLTSVQLLAVLRLISPATALSLTGPFSPWRSTNSYGLFSVMTTERPEITVEYSTEGRQWQPYRFRWKISSDRNDMPFFLPHMPRLDWQMWFAALEFRASGRLPGWFSPLLAKLEDKSPAVLSLLESPQGDQHGPVYFRISLDRLEFTSPDERRKTGRVWNSQPLPEYTIEGRLQR
jgi:predicted DCC family thiol-disulfide oxidoreductase YuxK